MTGPAEPRTAPGDRRSLRRARMLEEILDAALAVMEERGVAGLNLTEVATRVGLRQPSLYQYVDSRMQVYDALFERGANAHLAAVREAMERAGTGWPAARAAMVAAARFSVEQPVLSQLLYTPAVPGFRPSAAALRPSQEEVALVRAALAEGVRRGELRAGAGQEQGLQLLIAVVAGVSAQQAANDPGGTFDDGRFTALLEPALDMYERHFAV